MNIKFLGIDFDDNELKKAMKIAKNDIKNDKGSNKVRKRRTVSKQPIKDK